MHRLKPSLALAAAGVIGIALWAGARVDSTGNQMTESASRFLKALDDNQKGQATFGFEDPERLNWHFIPRPRKGLPIKSMTPAQRALAFGLVQSGLGGSGFLKATTIMSLEAILNEMEQGKGPVRDPELYYLSIFGTPSESGRWGWRVEGHHLSLNFTLEDGAIVSATPAFFGSNPGEVRQGPRQGLRTLADLEDRALRLLQALTEEQKKIAVTADTAPADVRAANLPQPPTDAAEGISYEQLDSDQKPMLQSLVEAYTADMTPEVATAWLNEIKKAGPENVRFSWTGAPDRNSGHAYKVQGPTFLIEFNNTQNNANHVHAVWRNMLGDFALPLSK
ncbi:DUF3500 domain-containing protein [Tundrisphaera lichenicola]|uniref:DUF3500 domain-containing protein n=1 Tax=Tundrisphaera lichenicola TaxID=2029860 RepID=UPI003EC09ADE